MLVQNIKDFSNFQVTGYKDSELERVVATRVVLVQTERMTHLHFSNGKFKSQ